MCLCAVHRASTLSLPITEKVSHSNPSLAQRTSSLPSSYTLPLRLDKLIRVSSLLPYCLHFGVQLLIVVDVDTWFMCFKSDCAKLFSPESKMASLAHVDCYSSDRIDKTVRLTTFLVHQTNPDVSNVSETWLVSLFKSVF